MFQRLSNLIRGFFSLFISGLERQNPEALLEVEQENLRRQIGQYNQGLATHAGLCERLISQVRQLENEQRDLRARDHRLTCVPEIATPLPSLRSPADYRPRTGGEPRPTGAGREDLQGPGQGSRCCHQRRAAEDRIAEGRHQRYEDEEGHGRADRDGVGNGHHHRRLGRDAGSPQHNRRGRADQGRRTGAGCARQHGYVGSRGERGRAEGSGRPGAWLTSRRKKEFRSSLPCQSGHRSEVDPGAREVHGTGGREAVAYRKEFEFAACGITSNQLSWFGSKSHGSGSCLSMRCWPAHLRFLALPSRHSGWLAWRSRRLSFLRVSRLIRGFRNYVQAQQLQSLQ